MKRGTQITTRCGWPFEQHDFTYTYKAGAPRVWCDDHQRFSRNLQAMRDSDGQKTGAYQWVEDQFDRTRSGSFGRLPTGGVRLGDDFATWQEAGKAALRALYEAARRWESDLLALMRKAEANDGVLVFDGDGDPLRHDQDPVEWVESRMEGIPGVLRTRLDHVGTDQKGRPIYAFKPDLKESVGGRRRVIDYRWRDWDGNPAEGTGITATADHTGFGNEQSATLEELRGQTSDTSGEAALPPDRTPGARTGDANSADPVATLDEEEPQHEDVTLPDAGDGAHAYPDDGGPLVVDDLTLVQAFSEFLLGVASKPRQWLVHRIRQADPMRAALAEEKARGLVMRATAKAPTRDVERLLFVLSPASIGEGSKPRKRSRKGNDK